jgi:hypothetical protein
MSNFTNTSVGAETKDREVNSSLSASDDDDIQNDSFNQEEEAREEENEEEEDGEEGDDETETSQIRVPSSIPMKGNVNIPKLITYKRVVFDCHYLTSLHYKSTLN